MRADTYATTCPTSITDYVLNMPIPNDLISNLIQSDTNLLYNLESGTIPSRLLDPLPESDDEYDAAEQASQQATQPQYLTHWEVTGARGGTMGARGGVTATRGGMVRPSGGTAGTSPAGELRPVKLPRFSEAPPAYGQTTRKWWECEEESAMQS
eukprot:1089829-Rhodomonas_salina.2